MTRIVAAVDFSPASTEALAYALDLARAAGAEVHAVHVLPWPDAGPFEAPGEARTAVEEEGPERRRAHEALRALLTGASDVRTDATVRRSRDPASALVTYAEAAGADLLVAGACGRRCPRLGAVAAELTDTAPCDVLLVPYRPRLRYGPPRRLVVPVDASAASEPLVRFALGLARDLRAEALDVVHVLEPMPYPVRWTDRALLEMAPSIRDRAGADIRALVDGVRAAVPPPEAVDVSVYVDQGKAAPVLVRVVEVRRADLLVVGPHAERPVFDRLLGSTARSLVRRMPCPVLVARASAAVDAEDDVPEVDARAV